MAHTNNTAPEDTMNAATQSTCTNCSTTTCCDGGWWNTPDGIHCYGCVISNCLLGTATQIPGTATPICKACDSYTTEDGWWTCHGDTYCWDCALAMDTELGDVEIRRIPTPEQQATATAWAAADIGAN